MTGEASGVPAEPGSVDAPGTVSADADPAYADTIPAGTVPAEPGTETAATDPDLLVLDEATSAVDPALEMRIARALERLMSGRTSVTIAHRMSTAEGADEVVVFDRGRVVQRGPHTALVGTSGPDGEPTTYARLHTSWVAQQSSR